MRNSIMSLIEREEDNDSGGFINKIVKRISIALLALFVIVTICNSFYILNENSMAVVTTFGSPKSVNVSGLHWKIPYVQKVRTFTKNIIGMSIGYDDNDEFVKSQSEMITSDFNFVNVDFYIEYQIIDSVNYYIHSETAIEILDNLAQSYIRDTVGLYSVDDVITTGKAEIQAKVREKLSERLIQEDIGIGIYNVTIQDAEPPTKEVSDAFKSVEDAKQGMDTLVNEANKYRSEQIPMANADADKILQDAEAFKQQRISQAQGQVARFEETYQEYLKYPLITKQRMFYEAMEEVMPSLKIIIDTSEGTQKIMPLEAFK